MANRQVVKLLKVTPRALSPANGEKEKAREPIVISFLYFGASQLELTSSRLS
jgi:hypothetical protein